MEVTFDPAALSPWTDIDTILGRMKSLKVTVGGEALKGDATLSLSDEGHAELAFAGKKAAPAKGKKV